ncbi:2-hydroxycarboxylate transporter family protein [Planomicrobium sp. CPCC 101079]|uniref:2-hydroxycarboxylate transporter family protein n=1 Tax=Planomicrobium sp. CPCC 101079 TaxID=2599618 RepID=UPI0011B7CC95|nr:2-hydroxycarboxylate transporter family protein [Planomicrobium sp. CPCC 101079]TWT01828.1 2-hydroxycarboxylate transporter family protein [Planomicrobium sp. CPCC 101079]
MSSNNVQDISGINNVGEKRKGLGLKGVKISGIEAPVFFGIAAIVLIGMYMELLPENIVSGLAVTMVLGGLLMWIGNSIPVFGTFGGGPILCILIPALFLYWGLIPESFAVLADNFYNEWGFAELVVTGLIVGSILSMDRKMLMKTGPRFFVPLLGGVFAALLIGGAVGHLIGFGFSETIFFVVGPIMGGGMAAGAVPMAEIYAANGSGDAGSYLAQLAPAVMVGNMVCILIAGGLNGLGKRKKPLSANFTGNGKLLRATEPGAEKKAKEHKESILPLSLRNLAVGLLIASGLFIFGEIVNSFVPSLHAYVWIILGAAALKLFRILPESIEKSSEDWYDFISMAWVPAVLVTISAGMIDFNSVLGIVTDPSYITLTILTVVLATLGAGFIGTLVGFYFVESSISAGLGMADMGGSGDVAVLSASERMGLMPFLQISSRIGGAMMLIILSILAPLLL